MTTYRLLIAVTSMLLHVQVLLSSKLKKWTITGESSLAFSMNRLGNLIYLFGLFSKPF